MEAYLGDLARVEALLLSVPVGPVELTELRICASVPEFLGCLVAPLSARAAGVIVDRASRCIYAGESCFFVVAKVRPASETPPESLGLVLGRLVLHTRAFVSLSSPAGIAKLTATIRHSSGGSIDVAVLLPAVTPGSMIMVHAVSVAGEVVLCHELLPTIPVLPVPPDLTLTQMSQLQEWLGDHAGVWQEVYRGTRDGFGAADFHAKCDNVPRLLVLACTANSEGGYRWLYGGFTAKGFVPDIDGRAQDDSAAFLFSLNNPAGKPTKLPSAGNGNEIYYSQHWSATFGAGFDMMICDNSNVSSDSETYSGEDFVCAFAPLDMEGDFPLATGARGGWLMAEVVAYTISACE